MPEPTALETQLFRIFQEQLDLVVPSADLDLFETGALDSLAFVKLLVELEKEFGIHVSLEDLELNNFRSIAKIAKFISDRQGAKVSDIAERSLAQRQIRGHT